MNLNSVLKVVQGWVKLKGGTDGTFIGNDGDRLKVISTESDVIAEYKYLLDGTTKNINVDGSSTAVEYEYAPGVGETFSVESLSFYMAESGGLAYDKFENGSSLSTGLKVEIKSQGTVKEFINLQTNADLALVFFGGTYTGSKNSWEGQTVFLTPVLLDNANGDYIKVIVRDDLSSVTYAAFAVRGYEEV